MFRLILANCNGTISEFVSPTPKALRALDQTDPVSRKLYCCRPSLWCETIRFLMRQQNTKPLLFLVLLCSLYSHICAQTRNTIESLPKLLPVREQQAVR